MGHAVGRGHPGAQQRVAHLVAARAAAAPPRSWPAASGRGPRRRSGPAPPAAGRPARDRYRDEDQHVRGERTGGVRDLGELRAVQRPVGDHAEHPARRQQRASPPPGCAAAAGTGRARRRPCRRTVPPTPDRPSRVGQASMASSAATGAPSGSVSTTCAAAGRSGPARRPVSAGISSVTATGHGVPSASRPAAGQRGQVGPAEEAGQRCVRPGEEQLQVGQLVRARRVRRRVAQHVLGQHRTVHRDIPRAD